MEDISMGYEAMDRSSMDGSSSNKGSITAWTRATSRRRGSLFHIGEVKEVFEDEMEPDSNRRSRTARATRRNSVAHVGAPDEGSAPQQQEAVSPSRKDGRRRSSLFHVEDPNGLAAAAQAEKTARKNRRRRSSLFHVSGIVGESADDNRSQSSGRSLKNPFARKASKEATPPPKKDKETTKKDRRSTRDPPKTRSSKDHPTSSPPKKGKGIRRDQALREMLVNMAEMERLLQAVQTNPESRKKLQEHFHKQKPAVFAPVATVVVPRGAR